MERLERLARKELVRLIRKGMNVDQIHALADHYRHLMVNATSRRKSNKYATRAAIIRLAAWQL